jgi:phage pi2 protein 07
MQEHNIIISVDEYKELVEKAEKIDAVERLINRVDFVPIETVKAILDIREKVGANNG